MRNSMLLQLFFYYLVGNLLFILFLSSIFYYTSKFRQRYKLFFNFVP